MSGKISLKLNTSSDKIYIYLIGRNFLNLWIYEIFLDAQMMYLIYIAAVNEVFLSSLRISYGKRFEWKYLLFSYLHCKKLINHIFLVNLKEFTPLFVEADFLFLLIMLNILRIPELHC